MSKVNSMRVKVQEIKDTVVFDSGFQKRIMNAVIEGEFPQELQFEFTKDNVALLDDVLEDTYVTVNYNIRSRKVTENKDGVAYDEPLYFISLNAWKVEA